MFGETEVSSEMGPIGAQTHSPAALMTHYSNHRVMSMAQYDFNSNTDCRLS